MIGILENKMETTTLQYGIYRLLVGPVRHTYIAPQHSGRRCSLFGPGGYDDDHEDEEDDDEGEVIADFLMEGLRSDPRDFCGFNDDGGHPPGMA